VVLHGASLLRPSTADHHLLSQARDESAVWGEDRTRVVPATTGQREPGEIHQQPLVRAPYLMDPQRVIEAARLLAAEGAKVVIGDVQDDLGLRLASEIGDSARFVYIDATNDRDWAEIVGQTGRAFGDATILVQSEAIVHHRLIEDSTRDDFDRVLAVNLVGPFIGMLAVLPRMQRARRGVIINVSSAASMSGVGGRGLYGASKMGAARFDQVRCDRVRTPQHQGQFDPAWDDRHPDAASH
jgi:short chain dehydrogenase